MGTPKFHKLDSELRELDAEIARRLPTERHKRRKRGLYVDHQDGTWSRPSAMSRTESAKAICDAVNDYASQRDRIENPELMGNEVLVKALRDMSDKPTLPNSPMGSRAFQAGL
jgi:hypothetical protein